MISLIEAEQFELPFARTTHPQKSEGNGQNARILAYLNSGKSLTALDALQMFGCFRLASRIHDLKKHGIEVKVRDVLTEKGKKIAQYYL